MRTAVARKRQGDDVEDGGREVKGGRVGVRGPNFWLRVYRRGVETERLPARVDTADEEPRIIQS